MREREQGKSRNVEDTARHSSERRPWRAPSVAELPVGLTLDAAGAISDGNGQAPS